MFLSSAAGHAGCEAATAAARRGARVGLVTFRAADLGQMSCNPSIGGVGKGHLVRELDVFDGLMARAADERRSTAGCSTAARAARCTGRASRPTAPSSRRRSRQMVAESGRDGHRRRSHGAGRSRRAIVTGVVVDEQAVDARAVVIATGTFLDARLSAGMEVVGGGRSGERAVCRLARQMRELGLAKGRLKTGTPPRLDGRTIDWSRTAAAAERWRAMGDVGAAAVRAALPQLACAITRTSEATHDVIRANFDRSPLFSGAIEGRGPRYCPSIEDKIRRFGDRDGHQIFLEPEGLDTNLVYPNGISTSLPADVQEAFVRTIPGLERVVLARPGYAVEYEYADARKLDSTLGASRPRRPLPVRPDQRHHRL